MDFIINAYMLGALLTFVSIVYWAWNSFGLKVSMDKQPDADVFTVIVYMIAMTFWLSLIWPITVIIIFFMTKNQLKKNKEKTQCFTSKERKDTQDGPKN